MNSLTPEQIIELRNDLNMSRAEFGQLMSIRPESVRAWEFGQASPSEMNNAYLIKLKEKVKNESANNVKDTVGKILLGAGFLALLTYVFSEDDKKSKKKKSG